MIDWSDVDWKQSNAEIARQKGCSKPSVSKARARITGEVVTRQGRPPAGRSEKERAAERAPPLWTRFSSSEIYKFYKISTG